MIKSGRPFCDRCNREIQALTEQECLDDIIPHGWTNWKTAEYHYCFKCSDELWQPPCGECETHPCMKGRDCWANPPLHIFPYETYYASALGEDYMLTIDEDDPDFGESVAEDDVERDLDDQVRRIQRLKVAGMNPKQKHLLEAVKEPQKT